MRTYNVKSWVGGSLIHKNPSQLLTEKSLCTSSANSPTRTCSIAANASKFEVQDYPNLSLDRHSSITWCSGTANSNCLGDGLRLERGCLDASFLVLGAIPVKGEEKELILAWNHAIGNHMAVCFHWIREILICASTQPCGYSGMAQLPWSSPQQLSNITTNFPRL